jgi:hypothetical protein
MVTGSQLKELLAPLAGINPATFNRYLTNLAEHQLVRRSRPGTGRAVVHLTAVEIVHVLLALAALKPAGAADAARQLGNLSPHPPQEGSATLHTALAGSIEFMAGKLRQGAPTADLGDSEWELTATLNPLRAVMAWPSRGATRKYLPYIDAHTVERPSAPLPLFRRDVVLTQPLLVKVATLYAEDGAADSAEVSGPRHTRAAEFVARMLVRRDVVLTQPLLIKVAALYSGSTQTQAQRIDRAA